MSAWPHGLTLKPIVRWPGEMTAATKRRYSPFEAGMSSTLETLNRELRELQAHSTVLQIALRDQDFRLDGYPRANSRPDHPGVILSFDSRKIGPGLSYPCDTFLDWQSNLRAIALALEALRKVDRYGVTARGEQYAGFKAIGSGIALPAQMSVEEAIRFVASAAEIDVDGLLAERRMGGDDLAAVAYRLAARKLHPDRGGSTADFQRLQDAKRVLDQNRPEL